MDSNRYEPVIVDDLLKLLIHRAVIERFTLEERKAIAVKVFGIFDNKYNDLRVSLLYELQRMLMTKNIRLSEKLVDSIINGEY